MYIKTAKVYFLLSRSEGADLGSCLVSYPLFVPSIRAIKSRSCGGTVDASDRSSSLKSRCVTFVFNRNMANAAPHNSATRDNVKLCAYETTTPLII